jgi:hypothetical protein
MTEQEFTPTNFKKHARVLISSGIDEQAAFELTIEYFDIQWSDKLSLDLAEKWFLDITKK